MCRRLIRLNIVSWNFSRPVTERRGVFIGTREFDVLPRNHLLALAAARTFSVPITVINPDGKSGLRRLQALKFPEDQLTVMTPLPYPKLLAIDGRPPTGVAIRPEFRSRSGGWRQSALPDPDRGRKRRNRTSRVPGTPRDGRTFDQLVELTRRLLNDELFYHEQLARLERSAEAHLSFAQGLESLSRYFPGSLERVYAPNVSCIEHP